MAGKLKNYITANTSISGIATISGRFSKNDIVYAIQDNNWKGYTSLDVDVLCVGGGGGAGGRDNSPGTAGGAGATILGRINVPTSKSLTVTVGGGGGSPSGSPNPGDPGGIGGLPGGGAGGAAGGTGASGGGGGGGGWSGIYDTSYSVYFDGSGDYLTLASSTAFDMGATNYTIEGWYYFTALPGAGSNDNLFKLGNYNPYLYLWGDGTIILRSAQVSGDIINVAHNFALNQWYHLALVKTGTSFVLYKNGSVLGSGTSSAIVSESKTLEIGGQSTFGFTGYMSNFRMVKDTSVYTSAFTPPAAPLTAISGTSLLTCQSATIIDNSTNAFAITTTGAVVAINAGATISYSNVEPFVRYFIAGGGAGGGGGSEGIQNDVFSAGGGIQFNGANGTSMLGGVGTPYPGDGGGSGGGGGGLYGGAGQNLPTGLGSGGGNYINPSYAVSSYFSNYFDGNGDYLTLPSGNASLQPASSDFTIEAWVYPTAFVTNGNPVAAIDVNGSYYAAIRFGYESSGAISLLMSTNGTTWNINLGSGLGTLTLNTWQHMAVSKSGTSVRVFLNGVQQGSTQTLSSATLMTGTNNWIGYLNAPSAQYVNGYISNWRLTKTALYTTTFTPSTTPLTAIANTSLLTCQSATIIDKSTNNFTITKNGDVIVREIHPFAIPTINAELGGGIGLATGAVSMPANVNFFGYTSAGSGGTFGRGVNNGANGTVVIRYTGYQKATGGNVVYDNGYTFHTYDSPGTFVLQ